MVNKSAIILFLFLYLIGTTQLRELLKFPILMEHFLEHKENSPKMDFWEYLCQHYSDVEHRDIDSDRDMQLPFKSLTFSGSEIAFNFNDFYKTENSIKITYPEKKQSLIYEGFVYTSIYLSNIWQPPKSC